MSLRKSKTVLAVCLLVPLLGSCAKTGAANPCAAFIPVYIDGTDAISDGTARQILTNNESGHTLCGWEYSSPQEGTPDNHLRALTN